ncbi:Stage V sporulation protein AE (SpoVAE) [Streptococcus dysgalactiae subsp. equisimilis AC-2713]|uniref:Stage V sporulation protein AE (SpoVAE) n=1 Tax=Streptococcus dysgalactiae subsp. equisimilis AC-2713 TaxID=759913 RepID=A0AB33R7P3_STREQ|nr:hypothetical protein HMPREF9963_0024 [Streptococcus dysgalactiae subsp. equisimilis SK1250]EPZ45231.1 hypothetical protein HMPREF1228_1922 [Streptococcus pyogenes GA41345]EPZ48794.1 hypothetical protein HMPREF1229_0885 [Streptococcus pyogenes GA40634]ERL12456.1 hypothetical protein HMPREF1231_1963 [Streptococcus pyogenes GA06023]ESA44958.1 hypothetical protein HMPREF1234_0908 [Streptococcus pyogenes GA41039]ESA45030.1 hypothetical protein HMPREF1232_1654 [Streptococcus pyogenes GA40468]ESA
MQKKFSWRTYFSPFLYIKYDTIKEVKAKGIVKDGLKTL